MKRLLVLVLTLCLAGFAYATDTGVTPGPKNDSHVLQNQASDAREGGESLNDAVPIPGLPFNDTGATCDNVDNYDEACPYTGSTAPDVVYSYTPAADAAIDIDLCGSLYDTKVFVYANAAGNLVACNDDFYFGDPCGVYVSKIENLTVTVGNTYYIVIDGYFGDCGTYTLLVEGFEPCLDVPCPPGGVDEGEPFFAGLDNYNGGCNSSPNVFQILEAIDEPDCLTLCATTFGFDFQGIGYRDTDWFEIVSVGPECIWTMDALLPTNMWVLLPDCVNQVLITSSSAGPCAPVTLTWPAAPGEIFWLITAPTTFGATTPEYPYVFDICGILGSVGTEDASWGNVKDMYR